MFGLIEKVKWFSAQRKLICKGLSYLLHVNSFGLSPNFRPNGLAQSFRSVLRTHKKIDFTFWFNFRSVRISDWAKRLSERLIQKVKSPSVFPSIQLSFMLLWELQFPLCTVTMRTTLTSFPLCCSPPTDGQWSLDAGTLKLRYNRLAHIVSSVTAYVSSRSRHFSIKICRLVRIWI